MSSAFDMANSISESSNHLPYGPSNVSAITDLSEGPITEFSESTKPSKSARVTRKHSVTLVTRSSKCRSKGKAPLHRRGPCRCRYCFLYSNYAATSSPPQRRHYNIWPQLVPRYFPLVKIFILSIYS